MSVAQCQATIGSREFTEWIAFFRMEHTISDKDDWRIALSTSQLINHICASNGVNPKVGPEDLLLKFVDVEPEVDQDTLKKKLMLWALSVNKGAT